MLAVELISGPRLGVLVNNWATLPILKMALFLQFLAFKNVLKDLFLKCFFEHKPKFAKKNGQKKTITLTFCKTQAHKKKTVLLQPPF